jgi:hypothetical protein
MFRLSRDRKHLGKNSRHHNIAAVKGKSSTHVNSSSCAFSAAKIALAMSVGKNPLLFSRVHHVGQENQTNANFLLFYCYGNGKSG